MRAREGPPRFPDPAASDGRAAELRARWQALFGKAPRLEPWLAAMLQRERQLLAERSAAAVEAKLWQALQRWLRSFEALKQFEVSAIATTLGEEAVVPIRHDHDPTKSVGSHESPERAVADLEALLGDPAFALAFHCVQARVVPALDESLGVPRPIWFGLLHASAPQEPQLSAHTAISLVLRALGQQFAQLPARARKAALRLFCAEARDLDDRAAAGCLREILPVDWRLSDERLRNFVAASARARVALGEASALCARLVAAVSAAGRGRPARLGGLSYLEKNGAPQAAPEEVAELARTARRHPEMTGLRQLLALL
jgi:hypothetical protein